ncbi:hypothetical protein BVX98_07990 [bacterium F11]|nr:hypothetical protein BVX98_07990 [bacterium F11]
MMRRIGVWGIGFCLAAFLSPLFGSDSGTTGANFLKIGVGARGLAMGEAYSAKGKGVEALYWNPANLVDMGRPELMISHNPMVENTSLNQLALAFHRGKFGVGLGMSLISHGTIKRFDGGGNRIGSFDASDQFGVVGFAYGGEGFRLGLAGKWFKSEIAGISADGMAGDVGMSFLSPLSSRIRHAFVARNFGSSVSFINQEDDLPLTFLFGNAVSIGTGFSFTLDVGSIKGPGAVVASGIEWKPLNKGSDHLAFRGGYNTRRNEAEKLSGASLGMGLTFFETSIDYAWVPFGELGDSHSVTLLWHIPHWSFRIRDQLENRKRLTPKMRESKTSTKKTPPRSPFEGLSGAVLITLRDGQRVLGIVVPSDQKDVIIIETDEGKVKIPKTRISKVKRYIERRKHNLGTLK